MSGILDRLIKVEERYEELMRLMADPEVAQNYARVAEYAKERADLEDVVSAYRAYRDTTTELEETKIMLDDDDDPEMRELADTASIVRRSNAWGSLNLGFGIDV